MTDIPNWIPIAVRRRGGRVETVHRGGGAAVDPSGKILFAAGDPAAATFFRSSVKMYQALPMVKSGAPEKFGFTPAELALSCASHNGEPFHAATAASMLKKMDLTPAHLRCGAHPPYNRAAANALVARGKPFTALHNNCSGKHSGMLACCLANGWPLETYLEPDHPLQQAILATVAAAAGIEAAIIPWAIDGCGVPTFFMPLEKMALTFARFGATSDPDLRRLFDAMTAHPEMVDGTGDFDTRVMEVTKGRMVCKRGGAALGCIATREGIGITVKCGDGTSDVVPVMLMRVLQKMALISAGEAEELKEFVAPMQKNVAGREVGILEAVF
jgi:L-asparaginase II